MEDEEEEGEEEPSVTSRHVTVKRPRSKASKVLSIASAPPIPHRLGESTEHGFVCSDGCASCCFCLCNRTYLGYVVRRAGRERGEQK